MSTSEGVRPDWATKDFYQVLGVPKDASAADIKKAYRKLARENHPDSNPGDDAKHEKFKAVAEAYDVIGDEAKRAKYDEFRALQARGGFGPGLGGGMGGPGFGGGGFNLDDLLRDRGGSGGLGDGLELVVLGLVTGVGVGVVRPGQLAVGLLEVGRAGVLLDAEDLVEVLGRPVVAETLGISHG